MAGYKHLSLVERPRLDSKIWRYMDAYKFLDLLERQALYFARADLMNDSMEGRISSFQERGHLEQYNRIQAECDVKLPGVVGGYQSAGTIGFVRQYRSFLSRTPRSMYLSCWRVDEDPSPEIWNAYCSDGKGVAIATSFGRLEDSLPSNWKHSIYAGLVRYLDYDNETMPIGNGFFRIFRKRSHFEHERELRLVAKCGSDFVQAGLHVPVLTKTLVMEVYASPKLSKKETSEIRAAATRSGLSARIWQ